MSKDNAVNELQKTVNIPISSLSIMSDIPDDSINLQVLLDRLWLKKIFILSVSLVFCLAGIIIAGVQKNVYKSDTILIPIESNSNKGMGALTSQFGGIASLAGVDLSSGGNENTQQAIALLNSRIFIKKIGEKYQILPKIMASVDWNKESGDIIYDASIFDIDKKEWVVPNKYSDTGKPSIGEIHKKYLKLIDFSLDESSSAITLAINHYSPKFSYELLKIIVAELNNLIKAKDQLEATESINFINGQLDTIKLEESRALLFKMLEEQTQILMLTRINKEYVLETIDPPFIPEKPVYPNRALLVILFSFIGFSIAVFGVLLANINKR